MISSLKKFQELLWWLFQFDCTDLDLGIYRIMNHKRDAIARFIMEDLPKAVADELDRGVLAELDRPAEEYVEVARQIKENWGKDNMRRRG